MRWALLALMMLAGAPAVADGHVGPKVGKVTGLPLPRYVSIRADEANLRVGPGGQYPIRWRLLRSGMPARPCRHGD